MKRKHIEIIEQAMARAQIITADRGYYIGQTICRPSQKITCKLTKIDCDMGTIEYKEIKQIFPLSELFDPNIAVDEALKIQRGLN